MCNFYPRSPRGERLSNHHHITVTSFRFLSTLPARGATCTGPELRGELKFLSTLPARGATCGRPVALPPPFLFLSTLPARGATQRALLTFTYILISIHAPREGSDPVTVLLFFVHDISIHAPREGSDVQNLNHFLHSVVFLSTLPARGATSYFITLTYDEEFLSTLPARGATAGNEADSLSGHGDFYPRSPRGERRRHSPIF